MYYVSNVYHTGMEAHLTRSKWRRVYKKFCTSDAMDGTDDGMLWNGSEEGGSVRTECEEDEGTGCEDGDSDSDR